MTKVLTIHGLKDKLVENVINESMYQQSFMKLIEGISKISNCIDRYTLFIRYDSIYKLKINYNDRDLYTVSIFEKNVLIEKKLYNLIRFLKQMTTKDISSIKLKTTDSSITMYP